VLGSGLGAVADSLEDRLEVPYTELPDLPQPKAAGHAGTLVAGRRGGLEVVCFKGRVHVYDGVAPGELGALPRTAHELGAEILVLTNAAGSLRPALPPGSLVAISDHINLQGVNPLAGEPAFVSLRDAYAPDLRARLHDAARACGVRLQEGVYLAVGGPSFETPAEVRAYRALGADLVGMSTVPEVIVARHLGLRVAALSVVTNMAEGMGGPDLSHEQTLAQAGRAARDLAPLLATFLDGLA
jgi:xanthosine phosphorylase